MTIPVAATNMAAAAAAGFPASVAATSPLATSAPGNTTAFAAGGAMIQADTTNNALIIMSPEPVYNTVRAVMHGATLPSLIRALLACAWARSEVAAKDALARGAADTAFYESKLQRARFQADYLGGELPRRLSAVERSRAELPFLPLP